MSEKFCKDCKWCDIVEHKSKVEGTKEHSRFVTGVEYMCIRRVRCIVTGKWMSLKRTLLEGSCHRDADLCSNSTSGELCGAEGKYYEDK